MTAKRIALAAVVVSATFPVAKLEMSFAASTNKQRVRTAPLPKARHPVLPRGLAWVFLLIETSLTRQFPRCFHCLYRPIPSHPSRTAGYVTTSSIVPSPAHRRYGAYS